MNHLNLQGKNFPFTHNCLLTKRKRGKRSGVILILLAFGLVALIGLLGLVFDIGIVYKKEAVLKKSVRLSLLAAGSRFSEVMKKGEGKNPSFDPILEQVQKTTQKVSLRNGLLLHPEDIQINPFENNPFLIRISRRVKVPIRFCRVFNLTEMEVFHQAYTFVSPEGQGQVFNDFEVLKINEKSHVATLLPSTLFPLGLIHARRNAQPSTELTLFNSESEGFKPGESILIDLLEKKGEFSRGLVLPSESQKPISPEEKYLLGCFTPLKVGDFLTFAPSPNEVFIKKGLQKRIEGDQAADLENWDSPLNLKNGSSRLVILPVVTYPLFPGTDSPGTSPQIAKTMIIGFARIFLQNLQVQGDQLGTGEGLPKRDLLKATFVSYLGPPPLGQNPAEGALGNLRVF